MTEPQEANACYGRAIYRIVWGVAGVLLACLGIYVVFFGVVAAPIRIALGLGMALLGSNAVWSSVHSKPSWVAALVMFT